MAYRLPGERVALDLDGPVVEVEPLRSWAIQRIALGEAQAFQQAKTPDAELEALLALFRRFVAEAQPSWDIIDHRGPVESTANGMLRLPLALSLGMVSSWLSTLPVAQEEPTTAVDAMVPPSPLRDELNKRLRAKRKAA